jgi:HSP20 family protein
VRRNQSEKSRKTTTILFERSYGSFERSFRLPEGIDDNQVKASFDKGVLRVMIPKKAEAASVEKKIPIAKG